MLEITVTRVTDTLKSVKIEGDDNRIDFGSCNEQEVKALVSDLASAIMELME